MTKVTKGYLDMELLRFSTAGSVDDGKSTLIGRLLYDSKAIFADQLEALELVSKKRGEEQINLALLTDGLKAEREQGITIDVAYRYFATPKRKFIIADSPGHTQYTRNMVTGASTANAAIILIDARKGVVEQTIRHSYIGSLLKIPHLIVCVNKMDMVGFSKEIFDDICLKFRSVTEKLKIRDLHFIPISALIGDNVVNQSNSMKWYKETTLMSLLENIPITKDQNHTDARFPIQYVIRPNNDEFHDYRGYAGRIAGGTFKVNDKIIVLPSGIESSVKSIQIFNEYLDEAHTPQSITMQFNDDIDISRGDMIIKKGILPHVTQDIEMMICWFNEKNLVNGGKYLLRQTTSQSKCLISDIIYKVNMNNQEEDYCDKIIKMNDIAKIRIRTSKPVIFDSYQTNRITGSIILINEGTNETVAAGMII
jgi:sulfate adenylyltransferase subunit 1